MTKWMKAGPGCSVLLRCPASFGTNGLIVDDRQSHVRVSVDQEAKRVVEVRNVSVQSGSSGNFNVGIVVQFVLICRKTDWETERTERRRERMQWDDRSRRDAVGKRGRG